MWMVRTGAKRVLAADEASSKATLMRDAFLRSESRGVKDSCIALIKGRAGVICGCLLWLADLQTQCALQDAQKAGIFALNVLLGGINFFKV